MTKTAQVELRSGRVEARAVRMAPSVAAADADTAPWAAESASNSPPVLQRRKWNLKAKFESGSSIPASAHGSRRFQQGYHRMKLQRHTVERLNAAVLTPNSTMAPPRIGASFGAIIYNTTSVPRVSAAAR